MSSIIKQGKYRHYKGQCYQVHGIAKHSETLEDMVIYQALYGACTMWARPLTMFQDVIDINGHKRLRFEFIDTKTEI